MTNEPCTTKTRQLLLSVDRDLVISITDETTGESLKVKLSLEDAEGLAWALKSQVDLCRESGTYYKTLEEDEDERS